MRKCLKAASTDAWGANQIKNQKSKVTRNMQVSEYLLGLFIYVSIPFLGAYLDTISVIIQP